MVNIMEIKMKDIIVFLSGAILAFFTIFAYQINFSEPSKTSGFDDPSGYFFEDNSIKIPMKRFPESQWRTSQTIGVKTVTSTPYARFEIHKVKAENGAIIDDWLWTDERSHVNILVHLKEENKFLLFHQRKYGLEKAYYAAVGGLFEPNDTPESCAHRELLEETGLKTDEMIYLGKYRVQVNRGGGYLHAFYAKNCVPASQLRKSDDYEKQEKRLLTKDQLVDVLLNAEIGEAQWLAAIATGLIYEQKHG